jgi:hypothetical protein
MSTIKFRIYVVLIGAIITFAGTRLLACDSGCNFGSYNHCLGVTGDPNCNANLDQVCEWDYCDVNGCGEPNIFKYCIGWEYQCQHISCTWNVYCGDCNGG